MVPSLPPGRDLSGYLLILMALIGSGTASLSNLKYASFVRERGWRDTSFLQRQRINLVVSGGLFITMLFLLQVAAAATLGRRGVTLSNVEDLLPVFTTALGPFGRIIFGIGVWTAVFTTFIRGQYRLQHAHGGHLARSVVPAARPVEHRPTPRHIAGQSAVLRAAAAGALRHVESGVARAGGSHRPGGADAAHSRRPVVVV